MGRHRRSLLGAGLMMIVLLAASFGPASSVAASSEPDSAPPSAAIADAHSDRAAMPATTTVASVGRDRNLARVLRPIIFVVLLAVLALAAASLTSSSRRRYPGWWLDPSGLLASGASRRGPPLVV